LDPILAHLGHDVSFIAGDKLGTEVRTSRTSRPCLCEELGKTVQLDQTHTAMRGRRLFKIKFYIRDITYYARNLKNSVDIVFTDLTRDVSEPSPD
jgi:hypothetical protein